jgi:hypothetical protein
LKRHCQNHVIPSPHPGRSVWRSKQRSDLRTVEKRHRPFDVPLGGHGQNLLAVKHMSGFAHRNVSKERPDCGEPRVSAARAVLSGRFQMSEEFCDHFSVKIFYPELCGRLAPLFADKAE